MVKKWAKFKGHLGWHKDMPIAKRHKLLVTKVKKDSYATIIRRLLQLANITKDKATERIARADMAYLKKKFRSAKPKSKGRGC